MINFNRIPFFAFVLGVCACTSLSLWANASILPQPAGKWNSAKQASDKLLQQKPKYDSKLQLQNSNRNRTQRSATLQREQFQEESVTAPGKTQLPDHTSINPSDWSDHFDEIALHLVSQISDANSSLGRCCFEKPLEEKHICLDPDAIDYQSFKRDNLTKWQKDAIYAEVLRSSFCLLIPKFLQSQCLESPEWQLDEEIEFITEDIPDVKLHNNIKWTLKRHMKHCYELESYSRYEFWNWAVGFRVLDYAGKLTAFFKYFDEESTSE